MPDPEVADSGSGMSFADLLAQPGVTEHHELRSQFGFLAYHGGALERVTSLIASAAARRAGATVYTVDQPEDRQIHIPSIRVDPRESTALSRVYAHTKTVCTVHGYGRERHKQHVLLGGQNRELAEHVADHLRIHLHERYEVVTDLDAIPKELRGLHPRNPVNLSANKGVQIELPPAVRWNFTARTWADELGTEPTEDVLATIEALAAAAASWDGDA